MSHVIQRYYFSHVEGLSFGEVASAMKFSNVGSYMAAELEKFLIENDLKDADYVLMADHSMGGRSWEFCEGRTPAYLPETAFCGGWYAITEGDAHFLQMSSATSGSFITAVKDLDDDTWGMDLGVPFEEDGVTPYQGAYWKAFHSAVQGGAEQEAQQEEKVVS